MDYLLDTESEEVRYAIKHKQENHRVEIRRKKVAQSLLDTRTRLSFQINNEIDQNIGVLRVKLLFLFSQYQENNEKEEDVKEKLEQLSIRFNLRDYPGCEEIVSFFTRYCIHSKDLSAMKISLEMINKTDFPLFLISFIGPELFQKQWNLFDSSLKILQNIPAVATKSVANKLATYNAIDRLLEVLNITDLEDDQINRVLHSLGNFAGSGFESILDKLISLDAISRISILNQFPQYKQNLLFFYYSAFSNLTCEFGDLSRSDQAAVNNVITYIMNILRQAFSQSDEQEINDSIWIVQALTKNAFLVQFDEISDYVLLQDILDKFPQKNIIQCVTQIINQLAYNSDKNTIEFIAFDYLSYLKRLVQSSDNQIRLNAIYALLNMACCPEIHVKNTLLDKDLVENLQQIMQVDQSNTIPKVCSLFFSNLVDQSNEIFIQRIISEFYFMAVCKEIFERIKDVSVLNSLLSSLQYMFDCIRSSDVINLVIQQVEYYLIDQYIDDLVSQDFKLLSSQASELLETFEKLKNDTLTDIETS